MKTTLLATAAVLAFGVASLAPAYAEGEGNGEPFPGPSVQLTTRPTTFQNQYAARDVGAAQYPNVTGRPGTDLPGLAQNEVLPAQGNETIVQTANSLPRGFEDGTVAYAQAQSVHNWMVAHNQVAATSSYASR